MTPNSLNADKVRYYIEKGLLSKRIDHQPEKLLTDIVLPPREIALAILEDTRLSDVYTDEMADEFAENWIVNRHWKVTIGASEVDGWAREWRFDRDYDD